MVQLLSNVLLFIGILAVILLALVGLMALVMVAMPKPLRQRAIPRGFAGLPDTTFRTAANRVNQIQAQRAHAEATAADEAHRQELAEGRA
jgi:flagellar basal body-associated protein FliL